VRRSSGLTGQEPPPAGDPASGQLSCWRCLHFHRARSAARSRSGPGAHAAKAGAGFSCDPARRHGWTPSTLRDAHIEFTLAHQSIADLELVSKEFAQAVFDLCRTREVLAQNNPVLCELIAKSIGTHRVAEKTVRVQQGALFTFLITGDATSKLVERYRLHPNAIKSLARCGPGYLVSDEGLQPVVYGTLPPLQTDYALPRNDQSRARGLRLYERFVQGAGRRWGEDGLAQ